MIYMDYAATAPMLPEVIDTTLEVMRTHFGNPSSLHRLGADAEALVRRSRENIAAMLKCKPSEIRFTSGGTESNNWAIRGAVYQNRHRGNHLITTMLEHASVYETFRQLEQEGFRVTYLQPDRTGLIAPESVEAALTEETILVSVMMVNNEIGRIQPIREIGELLRKRPKTLFHVDAIQAVGKLQVVPEELLADLLSCAAHKLGGPKGIGFLYCRSGLDLQPILYGGGQERGGRSGTENVSAIVGMAKAVRIAVERQPQLVLASSAIRERLVECIQSYPQLALTGTVEREGMAPHIVHFTYPGMKSEVLVHAFEQHDIYVSARSACSSGAEKPSRVLLSMGYSEREAVSGIRLSFSMDQTKEETEAFCQALEKIVTQLQPAVSPPNRKGRRKP